MDLAISEPGGGFGRRLAGFRQHHDGFVMTDRGEQVGDTLCGVGQFFLGIVEHGSCLLL